MMPAMTRVLVISDIHANQAALESVLAAAAGRYDTIWCLGDLVGYGPRPNECIEIVRDRAALCVMGNHDWAVLGRPGINVDDFNPQARQAVLWTRDELKPENRQYKQQAAEIFLAEKARMEQQQKPQAPKFDTEEEKLAYEFAQRYVVPQLMEPIAKLQRDTEQQLQINTALGYASSKATADPEFARALYSNEIGNVMNEYSLPPSQRSVDMAYDIWRGRKVAGNNQQQATNEQVLASKTALADEKSRAQLSTGGARTSGAVSQQDLLDKMREEIMNPSITSDQAVEIMKKKYKIDVGKPY